MSTEIKKKSGYERLAISLASGPLTCAEIGAALWGAPRKHAWPAGSLVREARCMGFVKVLTRSHVRLGDPVKYELTELGKDLIPAGQSL